MTCLILPAIGASADAAPARHAHTPVHVGSTAQGRSSRALAAEARTVPRPLYVAAMRSGQADRTLVSDAKTLRRCLTENRRHHRRCNAARRAVQLAGTRLAGAKQRLARIARRTGKAGGGAGASSNSRRAPQLAVTGQTLSWPRVANINTYVLASKIPGRASEYSLVSGTSITPPPVPGVTVGYSVRTTTNGSAWSTEPSITYAAIPGTTDTQAAPRLSVSAHTLTWSAVGNVTTYVLVRRVPGQADQYSVVGGTSITPASVPGATVGYSVRTAVDGSAWAPEVTISYPANAGHGSVQRPPVGSPSSGPFEMGVVSGSDALYDLPYIEQLGARTARVEVEIGSPASQMESTIAGFAQAGIRVLPLAIFDGEMPSPAEAQGLASWAARFGPGGTFWQGKSYPAGTAITDIEFGNETSYDYQYPDNSPAGYAARARSYAERFAEAATAIRAVAPGVGLLAQGDFGNGGPEWVNQMFKAVPNLGQLVAGWTIHPYGPTWQSRIDNLITTTQADGAPSTIPIFITEWGLDTDNGRCLGENYGWNECMTYSEAAGILGSVVGDMRARYGSRLAAFYLYQANDQQVSGSSSDFEGYFGALQNNGSPKGAFTTEVESLLSANP